MLSNNIFEIEVAPNKKVMEFLPGQFIFIRFVGNGISSEPHPFSMSSSNEKNNIQLVIKSLGDFTRMLSSVKEGMLTKVEGPFGSFYKNKENNKKEIWIAGGVGITPFLSMARSLNKIDYEIDLYYCLKNKNEAVLLGDINSIANANSKFKVMEWYSDEKGYIKGEEISKKSGDVKNTDIYICGPLGFMKSLREQFINLGVEKNNIHFEEFNFL